MAPPSPRKPLPQPVEETKRSSNRSGNDGTNASNSPRRSLPQPVETTSTTHSSSSSHSRHASTSSSSKGAIDKPNSESSNISRDPSPPIGITSNQPEPLTSHSSSSSSSSSKPRRKFAPEMIETSRRSRRNTSSDTSSDTARDENDTPPTSNQDSTTTALSPQEHLSLHMTRKRPDLAPYPPDNSPIASVEAVPQVPPESKFSSSKLAEKTPRRHSFRVPDLPAIKSSSETDEDSTDSSDLASSPTTPSADSGLIKNARRKRRRKKTHPLTARDSEDERFSGYLLSLAASAAEKQLRDQALAAYPNEHVHEQVDHWAGDQDSDHDSEAAIHVGKLNVDEPGEMSDDDEDNQSQSRASRRHRESAAGWDMQEMRKHQSRLEEQRQNAWASKIDTIEPELGARRKSVAQQQQQQQGQQGALPAPTTAPQPPAAITAYQKDNETSTMRKAASPPMAGENLRFPKCLSPQQTRMDVHQYPKSRGGASSKQQQEHTGLWTPGGGASRKASQSGLWMGVNAVSAQIALAPQQSIQTGLLTPALERGDPFSNSSFSSKPPQSQRSPTKSSTNLQLPPTPPAITLQPVKTPASPSTAAASGAAGGGTTALTKTKSLAEEFPDEFVTQLYNYLSLGYPTLARPYDDELCRITRIPIERLRKDDSSPHLNARGYIGAPEGTGCRDPRAEGGSEEMGERWLALRIYVWEWGRQQRGWAVEEAAEDKEQARKSVGGHMRPKSDQGVARGQNAGWGGIARKGSWAW